MNIAIFEGRSISIQGMRRAVSKEKKAPFEHTALVVLGRGDIELTVRQGPTLRSASEGFRAAGILLFVRVIFCVKLGPTTL